MEPENSKQSNTPKKIVKKVVRRVVSDNANGQNAKQNEINESSTPKKVVRKVVVKKTSTGSAVPQNGGKKIVKRVVRKTTTTQNQTASGEKKLNYKEEIEKLAPSNKNEQIDRSISSTNAKVNDAPNENAVIKSATEPEKTAGADGKTTKKVLRKKSKVKKFFKKYGVFLIIFFVFSAFYLGWTYLFPSILNFKITSTDVNDFLQPRIGFKVDYSNAKYYTTPALGVGVRVKNLKLVYPEGRLDDEKMLFMKSRNAVFEVPIIPLMMKTIKFNEFSLRSVSANLYRNKDGKYAYLEHFKSHFNPNAKKYLLEIPDIMILSYNMPSFDEQTKQFTKKRGAQMRIPSKTVKEVLKEAPKSNTIMIR